MDASFKLLFPLLVVSVAFLLHTSATLGLPPPTPAPKTDECANCTNEKLCFIKRDMFVAVNTCYEHGRYSGLCAWQQIDRYKPLNLLINVAKAFGRIDKEDRDRFRTRVNQLVGRVQDCNPAIFERIIKELDYRNTTQCPTGKEVCRQNAAYLWPLYCTMKKHLDCEGAGCETMRFQLELLYAVSYGLQMVNKRTQLLFRCEPRHQYFRHTDVRKELLEENTRISPGDVFAPSRLDFCDRTNDFFFNLYADRDDPQFVGCQREGVRKEYHRKFEWMGEVGHWRSEMEVIRFLALYLN